MSNAQRVMIDDEVETLLATSVLGADPAAAFEVLEAAYSIQTREQREMTLQEALVIIGQVARKVEEIGL